MPAEVYSGGGDGTNFHPWCAAKDSDPKPLDDGGISRSTDGGKNFDIAGSISTLSVVNIADVALPGQGPVISLNPGDNDGFTTSDGGWSWRPMRYGGGDNDCSWADPLRPTSMLAFTPRWDTSGNVAVGGTGNTLTLYETKSGGVPGVTTLPDVSTSQDEHIIPGPPLRAGSTLWNAVSAFVLNLPGDDPTQPGDYVFIRFFGNFSRPGQPPRPNNLAVLLRTRSLGAINARTDWDKPGGWRVDKHPRLLADLTASGRGDVVGFGDAGVYVALSNGDGTFVFTPAPVLNDFGHGAGEWRVESHLRFAANVTNDGRADIVGFGDAGVLISVNNGDATFQQRPLFVIPNFGFGSGGPVVQQGPFLPEPGLPVG
jgi:hypothetical protein